MPDLQDLQPGPAQIPATLPGTAASRDATLASPPSGAQSRSASDKQADWLAEHIGTAGLWRASSAAYHNGSALHDEIIAQGLLDGEAYAQALACHLGIPTIAVGDFQPLCIVPAPTFPNLRQVAARTPSGPCTIIDAASASADEIESHVASLRAEGGHLRLAAPSTLHWADEQIHSAARLNEAVDGLSQRAPALSAATGVRRRQILMLAVLAALPASATVSPDWAPVVANTCLGLPFLLVSMLRLCALLYAMLGTRGARRLPPPLPAHRLPRYSVLVPLYQEMPVLDDLITALDAIDYPRSKIEILLLIEQRDPEMIAELSKRTLPPQFRIVLVPDRLPYTKPKALNYGLQFATGELLVVFDAEDRPEPGQLKLAAATFATAENKLVCLQAHLNIYNSRQSWLTRQFAIEYSILFDSVLPGLARMRLPIPLGGTSNHFKRTALKDLGAWDPHNVTEDADLGLRIARAGFRTAMIASTTWEEAPVAFGPWLRQRTRWFKGWMQTWLVHTRACGTLRADLGLRATLGVHVVIAGQLLSAFAQPLLLALLIMQCRRGVLFDPAETVAGSGLLAVAWANLVLGHAILLGSGALCCARRRMYRLVRDLPWLPVYWMLTSVACYRAAWQLLCAPHLWEKTPHGAGRHTTQ